MKTFKELREASCGYGRKSKKEDATDDAIAAFKAKGGKIKKLPPAKAAGYHGKDDPGKGMHGMMDKGDTKAIGTRKKVKSMESTEVKEISKATKGSYVRKAADDMAKAADKMARSDTNTPASSIVKNAKRFVKRRTGIARATKDEGYVSAAQRKAVWASRADGGKGHPKNKGKK